MRRADGLCLRRGPGAGRCDSPVSGAIAVRFAAQRAAMRSVKLAGRGCVCLRAAYGKGVGWAHDVRYASVQSRL